MAELVLITQYTFVVTMLGMAGASVFFWLERDTLEANFRSAATIAGIYTAIAATMYFRMSGVVGTNGDIQGLLALPTHIRYIDWLITTPLMLVNLMILLEVTAEKQGVAIVIIAADIAMIVFGFFGERFANTPGMTFEAWVMFSLGMLAFILLLYMLYSTLAEVAKDKVVPVRRAFFNIRLFILIGWSIYPLGFVFGMLGDADGFKVARELVYNISDLVNKVGLGLIALIAAKEITRDIQLKRAMRDI
ncbi:MAG TPA: bacteriorhodopsin [Xanthomonadaceae bacterium]|nr:bacteriorhodopsin [Xanthomonadaceae bacterium]